MHITDAIQSLYPGAEWVLQGDTYEGLLWKDRVIPKPTEQELSAEVLRLQNDWNAKSYQRLRAPEYPSIGDQLDALWKGGDAAAEMLTKVQAVKNKYPKPE
jgi:hypothetical protein